MEKRIISLLAVFCLSLVVGRIFPQSNENNTQWMLYLEDLADNEDADPAQIETLFEELSYLSEHPFNIHTVGKEDLERLPFLSALQIENLLYYVYKYHPIVDIHELKNVEDMDKQTIEYLLPFVYIGEDETVIEKLNVGKALKYGKHEVLLGSNFTLQQKAGYEKVAKEVREINPNAYYMGNPYTISVRYNFNYKDRIQLGFTGEKDAGERFWDSRRKGFDFYAVNLTLKDMGVLKTLVLGDYRLAFGEGLVLNNHFSMGKTSDVANINQKNSEIKRDVSTNEFQYFNGVAGTLRFGSWETSLFYSYRRADANADSTTIYSFITDGYHRVPNDLMQEHQAEINLVGGHVQWRNDALLIGLSGTYYDFGGKKLNPDLKPYNQYYLRGKEHGNAGLHYTYHRRKWIFSGETAVDKNGKAATLNNLTLTPLSFMELSLSYRYYDKAYNALYGKAFSEQSDIRNEQGFYTGIKIHPFAKWELATYWDYFSFPWLRYGVDSPSEGNDFLALLSYAPKSALRMSLRYRRREKSKNKLEDDANETAVLPYRQQQLRYQLNYQPDKRFAFRTQIDYNLYQELELNDDSFGWSATQTASFTPDKNRFQIDAGLGYFHSSDWNTHISLYEKSILYTFSTSSYYGEGLRYYFTLKWNICKPLTLYLKVASTHYFDRDIISSGAEKIDGNEKSDVYFLVKYKF